MYAVITTFPNLAWDVYAKAMIQSFVKYWPSEVPLLVQLDDENLVDEVQKLIRPQDAIATGWSKEHAEFVSRNKSNDDPTNYRRQTTRFCHKVFAIHRASEAVVKQKQQGGDSPKYLIWMDADVITTSSVTLDDLKLCAPKEGDSVAYMGRKDWPHSECGWLCFDMDHEGPMFIDVWHGMYVSDEILKLKETHDSWAFDHIKNSKDAPTCTNLTEDKPGMDIWPHSPMGKWSTHYKGPAAKGNMMKQPLNKGVQIQTKNAIPDTQIREHISANQALIKNWIQDCVPTNEQIVVVSAGPQLVAEDVLEDYKNGKKIIAVKHALDRLRDAGIRPWACMLLDPRPHVYDFVTNPDPDVLWFVASQVNPKVTTHLLAHGCKVWGYHASVGAGEGELTMKQPGAVVSGGSATATRGLFVLKKLGFRRIKLYGYDLCFPDKVDLNALDEIGQPKYLEMSVGWNNPLSSTKKCFWTEPQLIAQFEEINNIIQAETFELEAIGDGIVPFVLKSKQVGDLRQARLRETMGLKKPVPYKTLLKGCLESPQSGRHNLRAWNNKKKTKFSTRLRNLLLRNPLKTM